MNDLECIVFEMKKRGRQGASVEQIMEWTNFDSHRVLNVLKTYQNIIFNLMEEPKGQPDKWGVGLIHGSNLNQIVEK